MSFLLIETDLNNFKYFTKKSKTTTRILLLFFAPFKIKEKDYEAGLLCC
jgi:hypothetical protein